MGIESDAQPVLMTRWEKFAAALAMALPAVFMFHQIGRADDDFWWHLRSGQWIWQHHAIPRADPFSYTVRGRPWVDFEWLFQALLYPAYVAAGFWGTTLALALAAAAAFYFLFRVCRLLMPPALAPWALLCAGVLMRDRLTFRPEVATFFFSALALWILESASRGNGRALWWYPLVIWLWSNAHGGFLLGLAMLGIYVVAAFVGPRMRWGWAYPALIREGLDAQSVGAVCAVSMVACLLNPYGWELVRHVIEQMRPGVAQGFVAEWRPMREMEFSPWDLTHKLHVATLWAGGMVLVLGIARWNVAHVALGVGLAILSLKHNRAGAIFGLLASPLIFYFGERVIMGTHWGKISERASRQVRCVSAVTAALVGLGWMGMFLTGRLIFLDEKYVVAGIGVDRVTYPAEGVQWLKQQRPFKGFFNDYASGTYLIWAYPEQPVFVDGRNLLYGDRFIGRYVGTLVSPQVWRELQREYQIRLIFLSAELAGNPLFHRSRVEEGTWKIVWLDTGSVILAESSLAAAWGMGQAVDVQNVMEMRERGAALEREVCGDWPPRGWPRWLGTLFEPRHRAQQVRVRKIFSETLFGLSSYQAAEEELQRALALVPHDAGALTNLGALAIEQGQAEKGADYIQRALAIEPRQPTAHRWLARLAADKGQYQEALREMRVVTEGGPRRPDDLMQQADFAARAGEFSLAARSMREAIETLPVPSAGLYLLLADYCVGAGEMENARAAYQKALALAADQPVLRAQIQARLGRLDQSPR